MTAAQLLDVAKQVDKDPNYKGFYAYWTNVLTQPKVIRCEMTGSYQDMPTTMRATFDQYIGGPAKQLAKAAAVSDGNYYRAQWRQQIQTKVMPWLDNPENRALKTYLQQFGPDFLNTLPSR